MAIASSYIEMIRCVLTRVPMRYEQVVLALKRERDLLQKIISISEHHLKLMEGGDTDVFENFWPVLARPMEELAEIEKEVDIGLAKLEEQHVLSPEARQEIEFWSTAISELATRLACIDNRMTSLSDSRDSRLRKSI